MQNKAFLNYFGHPEWRDVSLLQFYIRNFKTKPVTGIKVLYNHYKYLRDLKKEENKYVNFLKKELNV